MPPFSSCSGLLTRRWLPLLIVCNILLLVWYLLFSYQLVFHSDAAVKNLLAQEIIDSGKYFPPDWNYTNSDLWVFNTHSVIVLLLPFMQNGYLAHAASDLLSAALTLYGSWLLTGLLQQSRLARLLGMLVISGGMSVIMAEHVYGQAAYGALYHMACFLLYAYWRLSQAHGRRLLWWAGATVLLTMLVFWSNPQRALLFYGLPLLAGAALQQALEWRAARAEQRAVPWRQAQAMALVMLGVLAGILLNSYTLSRVHNNLGLTVLHWLDFQGMLHNLASVIHGVMALFNGLPPLNGKVTSLGGAYAALRVVGALLLIIMLPWSLYRLLQPQRGPRQLVLVFATVSFAANLFMMLTTSLADMGAPDSSVRYLVPSLLIMVLIFTGLMVDHRRVRPLTRGAGLLAIALLATSAPASYLLMFNAFVGLPQRGLSMKTPDRDLADFLQQQGLKYGYADFWVAGRTTVLSGGAVRVRPVAIERGLPLPLRKLSSNRWYTPEAWQGATFLMLSNHDLPSLDQALLASYAGQPRLLHYQDATILVYPTNPAAVLPEWDIALHRPLRYRIDAHTPHQCGSIEHGVITAQPGEQGALHFGPSRTLPPGAYTVSFALATSGDSQDGYGMVDVVSNGGQQVHARQAVSSAGQQRLTLRFDTRTALDTVEFRVFSNGHGRFALSGIDVVRTPTALEKQ